MAQGRMPPGLESTAAASDTYPSSSPMMHACVVCLQENEGGVSRDEMATALMEVVDGRIPKDRIALRELHNEIAGWPWLDTDEDQTEGTGEATANYAGITPTGGSRSGTAH